MQNVALHDITSPANVRRIAMRGAVLDVAWGTSGVQVFAGGLGKEVRSCVEPLLVFNLRRPELTARRVAQC